MSEIRKFSSIAFAILEALAKETSPQTTKQIMDKLKPEWRAKGPYQFSALMRTERIVSKVTPSNEVGYQIAKAGRDILKNKASLVLVDAVSNENEGLKHPDTGEPISAWSLRKLKIERGEIAPKTYKKKAVSPEQQPLALPNVSTNANNLMDNISSVIHENAAYRELLLRVGNEIAGALGMRITPREPQ